MEHSAERNNEEGRFTAPVEQVLREAGWYPGRTVDEQRLEQWYVINMTYGPGHLRIFPQALRILREFGDLVVKQEMTGVTCVRQAFRLDPLELPGNLEDQWIIYEWLLEETLFPLGRLGPSDEAALAVATSGRIFDLNMCGSGIYFLGDNIEQALETLIFGIMPLDMHFTHYERRTEEAARIYAVADRMLKSQ
jgi:hypothetical protein